MSHAEDPGHACESLLSTFESTSYKSEEKYQKLVQEAQDRNARHPWALKRDLGGVCSGNFHGIRMNSVALRPSQSPLRSTFVMSWLSAGARLKPVWPVCTVRHPSNPFEKAQKQMKTAPDPTLKTCGWLGIEVRELGGLCGYLREISP